MRRGSLCQSGCEGLVVGCALTVLLPLVLGLYFASYVQPAVPSGAPGAAPTHEQVPRPEDVELERVRRRQRGGK